MATRFTYDGDNLVSITDPDANIAVAAWLVYEGGGWRHWSPSAHCWGPELAHLG